MKRSKRQTSVLLKNIFSSYESAKLRGLRGLVDGVDRKFAWVMWVAWVYKILAWVKKNGVGGVGKSFRVGGVGPWNCFIEKTL